MSRSTCRAVRWGSAALLLWLSAVASVQAVPVALRLRPLRDAGGVDHALPARLTTALAQFLRDHGGQTLRVETAERPASGGERDPAARYVLEGDLSFASGLGEDSGRYLLVVRLLREGRTHVLIGQWAGSASSLRSLTANLRRDPRVHTLGLIGEIGSRILPVIAADAAGPDRQWRALLPGLQPMRSLKARIVPAQPQSPLVAEIADGGAFRIRFEVPAPLRAYLLLSGADGKLAALPLTVAEGKAAPHDIPSDSQSLRLPEGTREAWLLCRGVAAQPSAAGSGGRLSRRCTPREDEDDAPVHVLNGVGTGVAAREETLTPLLEEIARDPAPWRVLRLRVATPRK